jgi:tRNA dimethylallyltransferase
VRFDKFLSMSSTTAQSDLIVLAGPTASGKTALALRLAKKLDAEIIGADSQQVYRYFDIGTAKPTASQLAEVHHHLISVVDPAERFSAAQFQELADAAIKDIRDRSKRVLVVGGTGLYLRTLLHGIISAPAANLELRRELEAEAAQKGREALHRRLAQVDPLSAEAVKPTDLVRIIRALEIHRATGVPASQYRQQHHFLEDRYQFALYVLSPPRAELYRAIDQRAKAMFAGGLLEEVRSLAQRGFRNAPPMSSMNYAQAIAVIEGRMSLEEAIASAAQQVRRYAKRQLTWFRAEANAKHIEPPYVELDQDLR